MSDKKDTIGIVFHPDYLIHTNAHHPERKERLDYILKKLDNESVKPGYNFIEPGYADIDTVALVHGRDYIESVQKACRRDAGFLDMDTYIVPESYDIALRSAGGAVQGLDEVMNGNYRRVFCLIRPPGHHAEENQAMGFCIFNNIAVAARVAQRKYGLTRIAIIDWDVHHGNGTQHTFARDNQVLFFSVHQSPAYPGTGSVKETGRGDGEGFTINVPLPGGCGDEDYLYTFKELLVPVLEEFRPQLIMLSAGQDAYHLDPLAGMNLTLRGYYEMARIIADLADKYAEGRILACMEGGYHLEGQSEAVLHALNALGNWGLPIPHEDASGYEGEMASRRVEEVKKVHSSFWNNLK